MFDFGAAGRDEGGAHGLNKKGLVSIDRKVKKDAFYLYKAAWSREPFVHIRKVQERNKDYLFQKEVIVNWFDREELDPTCFSIQDTMGAIMANLAGAAILSIEICRVAWNET